MTEGGKTSRAAPVITPLTASDVDGAARLYAAVFLADEPTTHRHAPDPALFLDHARPYVQSLAGRGESFLARDGTTGELAGFIFAFDMTKDPADRAPSMGEFLAHFREAVAMISELEQQSLMFNGIAPGTALHVFQIGTGRQYRGQGFAQALIGHLLACARERGYRQVVADCTSAASRRLFETCGFSEAGSLSYEEFSMDGTVFFSGLDGGIHLMVHEVRTVSSIKPS
jgi:ribosomal protein S18 acetylase RimI-like enzyme